MNQQILLNTLEQFAKRHGQKYDQLRLNKPLQEEKFYEKDELSLFINDFILLAGSIEISTKVNYVTKDQLRFALQELFSPMLVFEKTNAGWTPVIYYKTKEEGAKAIRILAQSIQEVNGENLETETLEKAIDPAILSGEEGYILITGVSWKSLVSFFSEDEKIGHQKLTPIKRLYRLLKNEKRDIWFIYVYAMVIGLISLSLPIGIQSIINLISGGRFFNSIVVLISLVIVGVLISGALQVMQMTLVEILQRRIFAKASFELSFRIPRIKMESLAGFYPPELMNRFFEVINIQKGLPKLLIDISAAFLQIVFGLLLLSFYHPFFLVFTAFLVGLVYLIFHFTGNNGLETKLRESKYKYRMAQWFEELARTLATFKLAGTTNLPLSKTDKYVNSYLHYRKKHFGILVIQYINVLAFKTLVTAGILILGTILVVDRQITLGQFVASELVIIIVVAALEKIILNIDVVYDLLVAVDKLGNITDFPLEENKGFVSQIPEREKGLSIRLSDIHFRYPHAPIDALNGISLNIPAGCRFCVSGYSESGKETLMRLLSGFYTSFKGNFYVNEISFRDIELHHYRDLVFKNFDRSEIFDGTILENITLGKSGISYSKINDILKKLHLSADINQLENGILTELSGTGNQLANSVLEKIILARCLVNTPALLLITYPIFMLEPKEKEHVYSLILDRSIPMTVGFLSNEEEIQKTCDLVILMEKGKIKAIGPYETIKPELNGF